MKSKGSKGQNPSCPVYGLQFSEHFLHKKKPQIQPKMFTKCFDVQLRDHLKLHSKQARIPQTLMQLMLHHELTEF